MKAQGGGGLSGGLLSIVGSAVKGGALAAAGAALGGPGGPGGVSSRPAARGRG